jgi:hypothetical protein
MPDRNPDTCHAERVVALIAAPPVEKRKAAERTRSREEAGDTVAARVGASGAAENLSGPGYPETGIRGILGRDFVGFPGEE